MADLIDRQDLLANLNRFAPGKYDAIVNDIIKRQPAVEGRKPGRWKPHEDEDGAHYGDRCSECGEWYVMPYGKANFCPNCGADMRTSK